MRRRTSAEFAASARSAVEASVCTPNDMLVRSGVAVAFPSPVTVMPSPVSSLAPTAVSGTPTPASAATASTSNAAAVILRTFMSYIRRRAPRGHNPAVRYQFVDCRWELGNPSRGRELYLSGHIPGASFLDVDEDLSD